MSVAASMVWWLLTWTALAGCILLVTQAVTSGLRNAAARHLAWLAAFFIVGLFPAFVAATLLAQRQDIVAHCDAPVAVTATLSEPNAPKFVCGIALIVWSAGFAFTLARAAFAWRAAGRLYARSRRLPDALLSLHLLFCKRHVEVRITSGDDPVAPITWGVRKPVILLPAHSTEWDVSRRTAALLHEMAHVHRLDNLTQLCALLICAAHWFNPFVWCAARQMEADAEIAADDFAILRGVRPSTYAQALLRLATQLSKGGPNRDFARTAMLKATSALEYRLRTIVDPNTARGSLRPCSLIAIAALLLGAALATAAVTPRAAAAMHSESPTTPSCLATNPS